MCCKTHVAHRSATPVHSEAHLPRFAALRSRRRAPRGPARYVCEEGGLLGKEPLTAEEIAELTRPRGPHTRRAARSGKDGTAWGQQLRVNTTK